MYRSPIRRDAADDDDDDRELLAAQNHFLKRKQPQQQRQQQQPSATTVDMLSKKLSSCYLFKPRSALGSVGETTTTRSSTSKMKLKDRDINVLQSSTPTTRPMSAESDSARAVLSSSSRQKQITTLGKEKAVSPTTPRRLIDKSDKITVEKEVVVDESREMFEKLRSPMKQFLREFGLRFEGENYVHHRVGKPKKQTSRVNTQTPCDDH